MANWITSSYTERFTEQFTLYQDFCTVRHMHRLCIPSHYSSLPKRSGDEATGTPHSLLSCYGELKPEMMVLLSVHIALLLLARDNYVTLWINSCHVESGGRSASGV